MRLWFVDLILRLSDPKPELQSEVPRPLGGVSRHCNIIHIVPLNPAYPAFAGRVTVRPKLSFANYFENRIVSPTLRPWEENQPLFISKP
jgi:hypothetical protein